MPELIERTDPEGVDFGWVMQMTFVLTILIGAPIVAILSAFTVLPGWGARASFAIQVGAPIWLCTSIALFLYEKRRVGNEADTEEEREPTDTDTDTA
ncbi:DUF5822 domain-containing protein [Haloferacaceae archaeon YAN]|nr:hypothetical protein [Halorubraceae archaeon YAN]